MLVLVAAVAGIGVAWSASRMLDGVTGDTYGACIEIAFAAVLLSTVAAGYNGWLEPPFLK